MPTIGERTVWPSGTSLVDLPTASADIAGVGAGGAAGRAGSGWCTGAGAGITVPRGTRVVNAPMGYLTGGGFAGGGGTASPPQVWGTTTFSFPDCNTLKLGFTANPGLPAGVPRASGTREWTRVANVNNLACE